MILPLILIYGLSNWEAKSRAVLVSILIVIGGFCQLYVILIGGQAYPLEVFPGYDVTSSFGDGQVASYSPSIYELALGLGGVALTLLMIGGGAKVLRVLPTNLKDANIPEDD
jgi:molybdopterin-containing oxidoreductase family membrane subunit